MQEPKLAESKRTEPSIPITHWAFVYRPAVATDVTITWRKFGWVPVEIGCKSHLSDILGKGQGCVESIGHLKEQA